MEELLAALQPPKRLDWRKGAVLGALLVVGGVGGTFALMPSTPDVCESADQRAEQLWNDRRSAAIEEAFASTGLEYAPATHERLERRVDPIVRAWASESRDACQATKIRAEQSERIMDLRMACLDRQWREVDALLTQFETADATVVEHAITAIAQLPDPESCADVDSLLGGVAPPSEPRARRQWSEIRDELTRIESMRRLGRYRDAMPLAESVVERARALDHGPTLAEALHLVGRLHHHLGREKPASDNLLEAHASALASGHDAMAALTAAHLVRLSGDHEPDGTRAFEWATIAEAEHARAGRRDLASTFRSRLLLARSYAHMRRGELEAALQLAREGLAARESELSPDDPRLATAHDNLAGILAKTRELDEAREYAERALEMRIAVLGEGHPALGESHNKLGSILLELGELGAAEKHLRRAVAIRERALGADDARMAGLWANLGVALRRNGKVDEARAVYERALRDLPADEDGDPQTPFLLQGLATIEYEAGEYGPALEHNERALEIYRAHYPPDHPWISHGLRNRASVLVELDREEEAWQDFERSIEIAEKVWGAGHELVADGRFAYAFDLERTGQTGRAVALAELALERMDADADPAKRQEIQTWLSEHARGYADPGARERSE
jgi:tetratricopeptide (TPR) repeat protein